MRDNFAQWARHYESYLVKYYNQLCLLFDSFKEPRPSYYYFCRFCYNNTKKTCYYSPGHPPYGRIISAPLY